MNAVNRYCALLAVALAATSQLSVAGEPGSAKAPFASDSGLTSPGFMPKAASAKTIASRATATSSATVYGGFELAQSATVYILVRGNSLGTLGVTQNYLDLPRFRLYNQAGADLIFDNNGRAGFNRCLTSNADDLLLINYYIGRGAPVQSDDACLAAVFTAGVYTFSVTPSIPGVTTTSTQSVPTFGEILFEVTLGP